MSKRAPNLSADSWLREPTATTCASGNSLRSAAKVAAMPPVPMMPQRIGWSAAMAICAPSLGVPTLREGAVVIDEQSIVIEPRAGGDRVVGKPPVVHQMPDVDAAGEHREVGDDPAMATPPDRLAAHDRGDLLLGFLEHFLHGG